MFTWVNLGYKEDSSTPLGVKFRCECIEDGHHCLAVSDCTPNMYKNIEGSGVSLIKEGSGQLTAIVINQAVSNSEIRIYDSLIPSGDLIAKIAMPFFLLMRQVYLPYNIRFLNGLTIETPAGGNVTVIYR